ARCPGSTSMDSATLARRTSAGAGGVGRVIGVVLAAARWRRPRPRGRGDLGRPGPPGSRQYVRPGRIRERTVPRSPVGDGPAPPPPAAAATGPRAAPDPALRRWCATPPPPSGPRRRPGPWPPAPPPPPTIRPRPAHPATPRTTLDAASPAGPPDRAAVQTAAPGSDDVPTGNIHTRHPPPVWRTDRGWRRAPAAPGRGTRSLRLPAADTPPPPPAAAVTPPACGRRTPAPRPGTAPLDEPG